MAPRWTGRCGALATSPPDESNTAQEKSSRSLMFTLMEVRWSGDGGTGTHTCRETRMTIFVRDKNDNSLWRRPWKVRSKTTTTHHITTTTSKNAEGESQRTTNQVGKSGRESKRTSTEHRPASRVARGKTGGKQRVVQRSGADSSHT